MEQNGAVGAVDAVPEALETVLITSVKPEQHLVVFTPSGRRSHVAAGTTILDAARQLGVDLDSVCGGRGICGRCKVQPAIGEFPKHGISSTSDALQDINDVERRYDRIRGLGCGKRLGCQARIHGDLVIDVPSESQVHKQIIRKSMDERPVELDPATRLYFVEVAEPDMGDPSGDWQRVRDALETQWDFTNLAIDIDVLARLQQVLRKGDWQATFAVHRRSDDASSLIIGAWPGYQGAAPCGLAIDLGSTTIAAHLCNLRDGSVLASAGLMNPQIRFGEDLMSRVSYAMMHENGQAQMTAAVRDAMNDLVEELNAKAEIDPSLVLEAVFVCNPVMHHLLLGIDPTELGQAPFALATNDAVSVAARDLNLSALPKQARIHFLPCVAGHVGADAAAVILSERPDQSPDRVLTVDVGTNAEIIFGDRNRVLACSSPTGPAFEGAQISSGQRAAPGAIERVRIDAGTKEPRYRVIGCDLWSDEDGFEEQTAQTGITGICGSGIIEAIAEMRLAGLVDGSGLIGTAEQTGTRRCRPDGRTSSFLIRAGNEDASGSDIMVTQADVRAVQLAKSALYAGARLLMEAFGSDKVDRIILAGAFGSHISPLHAMILGMIPDCDPDRVKSAGNAAGTGARIALCNLARRLEIETIIRSVEKVETAVDPRFQDLFVAANALPHATDPFPELSRQFALPTRDFNDGRKRRGRRN